MKDYRLSGKVKRRKVTTLYANTVVLQKPHLESSNLIFAYHASSVRAEQKRIVDNGEKIEMSQSAQEFNDKGRNGIQTVLWHGPTATPSYATYIRTFIDGKVEIWTELIGTVNSHRSY